jgi:hypothetical protein
MLAVLPISDTAEQFNQKINKNIKLERRKAEAFTMDTS